MNANTKKSTISEQHAMTSFNVENVVISALLSELLCDYNSSLGPQSEFPIKLIMRHIYLTVKYILVYEMLKLVCCF